MYFRNVGRYAIVKIYVLSKRRTLGHRKNYELSKRRTLRHRQNLCTFETSDVKLSSKIIYFRNVGRYVTVKHYVRSKFRKLRHLKNYVFSKRRMLRHR